MFALGCIRSSPPAPAGHKRHPAGCKHHRGRLPPVHGPLPCSGAQFSLPCRSAPTMWRSTSSRAGRALYPPPRIGAHNTELRRYQSRPRVVSVLRR
ncbi:hypothetical protein Hanom_Chr04g00385561 [Helianthus anomalus]